MSIADQAAVAVRQSNARGCLLALRDSPAPLTVAEVAARTGLSRPTADAVLQGLVLAGPVALAPPVETTVRGRPARRFGFDPSAATVAAVDIGSRTIHCLLADAGGAITVRQSAPVDPAGGASRLDTVVDLLHASGEELDRRRRREDDHAPVDRPYRVAAVGVAVPGILTGDGRVTQSLAIPDLVGVDIRAELGARLGCPVIVENDIKLAAYAEHHLGPPASTMTYLDFGHRISVALIVEGKILQGSHRLAGELGSQRGMRWTRSSRRGRLRWSTGDTAEQLFIRAAAGEREAIREIDRFCAEVAPRIAAVLLTIDPDLVVVGGGLARAGSTLLDPLRENVHQLLITAEKPDLVAARLTSEGAAIGALGYAFEEHSTAVFGVSAVPPSWHRFDPPPRQACAEQGSRPPLTNTEG